MKKATSIHLSLREQKGGSESIRPEHRHSPNVWEAAVIPYWITGLAIRRPTPNDSLLSMSNTRMGTSTPVYASSPPTSPALWQYHPQPMPVPSSHHRRTFVRGNRHRSRKPQDAQRVRNETLAHKENHHAVVDGTIGMRHPSPLRPETSCQSPTCSCTESTAFWKVFLKAPSRTRTSTGPPVSAQESP